MIGLLLIMQPALDLDLTATDPSCPDPAEFREMVAQSTALGEGPPTLAVQVILQGPPWRATIGDRTVEGESCAAVAAAAAVIIALQLDALPPPPPPEPPPPPPPPPKKRIRTAFQPIEEIIAPPIEDRVIPLLRFSSGVAIGPLPDPTMSIELSVGLLFGLLRAEAFARHLLQAKIPTAAFSIAAGGARLCLDVAPVHACLAAEAGALFARGLNLTDPESERRPWLALGAAIGASIPLTGPLLLMPKLRAEIPLSRPHFTVDDREIHRPKDWSLCVELGLEVRF
jgi:hypothetical protein